MNYFLDLKILFLELVTTLEGRGTLAIGIIFGGLVAVGSLLVRED